MEIKFIGQASLIISLTRMNVQQAYRHLCKFNIHSQVIGCHITEQMG
jgi:hypothetical protein